MKSLMEKEIYSEPIVISKSIESNIGKVSELAKILKDKKIKTIFTMSRGSSDNAATCFSYACQKYTNIKVGKIQPSTITIYNNDLDFSNTCVLVISQSGMSKDTIDVINKCKDMGAFVVSVTNNENSTAAKISNYHLFLNVDEEKSVAATKTFVSEIVVLYMLVNELSDKKICDFSNIPNIIKETLSHDKQIQDVTRTSKELNNYIILSRGLMLGVAHEFSLKLTECCYLFTKSFSTATFMHGPLSLADNNANIIILAPDSEFNDEYNMLIDRFIELGVNLLIVTNNKDLFNKSTNIIKMPEFKNDIESSISFAVAISIYALNIGTNKGIDVDNPRNLNKVTITK